HPQEPEARAAIESLRSTPPDYQGARDHLADAIRRADAEYQTALADARARYGVVTVAAGCWPVRFWLAAPVSLMDWANRVAGALQKSMFGVIATMAFSSSSSRVIGCNVPARRMLSARAA